jgi:hypothetical protein
MELIYLTLSDNPELEDPLTHPEHLRSLPFLSKVRGAQSLVFCALFYICSLSFSTLYCLSLDLQVLITPLVSSNSLLSGWNSQIHVIVLSG